MKRKKLVHTPTLIDDSQKSGKCTKCKHVFKAGDSIMTHYIRDHIEFILNLLSAGEKTLGLQHDKTLDQFYIERQKLMNSGFQAPKCKKCKHENPNYLCVSNDKRGIRLQCAYCGNISVKN